MKKKDRNETPRSRDRNQGRPDRIAFRKTCKNNGSGLSHYIFMEPDKKPQ